MNTTIKNGVMEIVKDISKIDVTDSSWFIPISELGIDSLSVLEIIVTIENKYNISINDELIFNVTNLEDICLLIDQLIN